MTPTQLLARSAAVALLATSVAAPAQAVDRDGSSEYTCRLSSGLAEGRATLGFSLDVPSRFAAGEDAAVNGIATLTLDASMSTAIRLSLGSSAELTSESIAVGLIAGEQKRALRLAGLSATASKLESPVVLTGPVRLPSFVVPSDASTVDLRLPTEAAVSNPLRQGPTNVVFTGSIAAQGGLATARTIACWKGTATTIASVPVTATATSGASLGGVSPSSGFGGPTGSSLGTIPAPGGDLGAVDPAAQPGAGTGPVTLASAPIPPATRDGSIVLPYWLIAVLAVGIPGSLAASIALARRRIRSLQGAAS